MDYDDLDHPHPYLDDDTDLTPEQVAQVTALFPEPHATGSIQIEATVRARPHDAEEADPIRLRWHTTGDWHTIPSFSWWTEDLDELNGELELALTRHRVDTFNVVNRIITHALDAADEMQARTSWWSWAIHHDGQTITHTWQHAPELEVAGPRVEDWLMYDGKAKPTRSRSMRSPTGTGKPPVLNTPGHANTRTNAPGSHNDSSISTRCPPPASFGTRTLPKAPAYGRGHRSAS